MLEDSMNHPQIIAPRGPSLVDEQIEIQVNNLRQFQHVTLRVELKSEKPVFFESYGHYIANTDGRLNLSHDSSFGGTYKGRDNMGLFWSMLPVPGQRKGVRFTPNDVTKPMEFRVFLFDGHVLSQKKAGSVAQALERLPQPIATTTIYRTYLADNVERQEISVGRIRGTLFVPRGEGKFPGVIDMFGGHGELLEFRAAILASNGFASLALAFFAHKDLPKSYRNLDLEYFMEATQWLAGHGKVYSSGIGYIGVSIGGQFALQVSAKCPFVRAVVAISTTHWQRIPLKFKGQILGYTEKLKLENAAVTEDNALVFMNLWKDIDRLESLQIPVEEIEGKILLIGGSGDLSLNTVESVNRMKRRLNNYGRRPLSAIVYPGAGHLIEVPYMPMCSVSYLPALEGLAAWGGNVMEHSTAQEHSWCAIKRFLLDNIQDVPCKL